MYCTFKNSSLPSCVSFRYPLPPPDAIYYHERPHWWTYPSLSGDHSMQALFAIIQITMFLYSFIYNAQYEAYKRLESLVLSCLMNCCCYRRCARLVLATLTFSRN